MVDAAEAVEILGPPPRFVSRAGAKLEGAIIEFDLAEVFDGARVLDAGASTGGFTDCSLQYGAAEVISVDVGHNQFHESMRAHPRVVTFERTNLRTVDPTTLGDPVDVVVGDLSFISLALVLDNLIGASVPGAVFVLLVKPQFEAGRTEVSRGKGIITDPEIWHRVLTDVSNALVERNAAIMGAMVSPITGSDGNVEFVILGRFPGSDVPVAGSPALDEFDRAALIDRVVASIVKDVD